MSEQPYYFQIVPKAIISRTFEKQVGEFRFHVYKSSQRVDFSKVAYTAQFIDNKMKIQDAKLHFFLPNYFSGKNSQAKFIFQLSLKAKYYEQKVVGQYVIDANIYVEQFKRTNKNYFAEIWAMSENYVMEIQIFFDQSRYLLQKLLSQHKGHLSTSFDKSLVSSGVGLLQTSQIFDKQQENQVKYKQKRMTLLNQYAGAVVGQGGYRIFDSQQHQPVSKAKKSQSLKQPLRESQQAHKKQNNIQDQYKNLKIKQQNQTSPQIKMTDSYTLQDPQAQIKSLKYLIIAIVLLIVLGCGYFLSKIYSKGQPATDGDVPYSKPKKSKGYGRKKTAKSKITGNKEL